MIRTFCLNNHLDRVSLLNLSNFIRMKHFGFVLVFCTSICSGQTAFDRSETLFNKYLFTDSTKAKGQLEFQRKHARSSEEKSQYGLNQAEYYYHNNRLQFEKTYLEKLGKKINHKQVELEGEFVRIQSLILFKESRFKESRELITKFFSTYKDVPIVLKSDLEILISENDIALGDYAKAQKRTLISYNMLRKKPSLFPDEMKVRLFTSLYSSCYYQAKYDSALYYIYQSEPYLEEGTVAKASFYSRLATVYTVMRKHHKAILYYKKSIVVFEKSNAPILLAHSYYNLGQSTKEIDPEKAIPIFEKALEIARKADYERIVGYALEELGDLHLTRKDYARAAAYNTEALEIMRRSGDPHGIVNVLLNMGKQEYETSNFDTSLGYLNEALEITEDIDDLPNLEYCYEYLYKSYERMGDYKMAHHYHKLYTSTQRKIFKMEMQENIENLNLTYHVRLERATNKLLKKEVNLKNKKLGAERNVKWLLGTLILMLLIAGLFLRRFFVQRNKLKEFELQLAHSELKGLEEEKERTVEELDTVKDELTGKNDLIKELNKLLIENEQSLVSKEQFGDLITNDLAWVEFLAKLQLVFPDFTENLKTRHPGLSNNEFRLAALVRLSLSDKEISQLLIIEPASVKKAKNRLKQKLGLESNDKLSTYLGEL